MHTDTIKRMSSQNHDVVCWKVTTIQWYCVIQVNFLFHFHSFKIIIPIATMLCFRTQSCINIIHSNDDLKGFVKIEKLDLVELQSLPGLKLEPTIFMSFKQSSVLLGLNTSPSLISIGVGLTLRLITYKIWDLICLIYFYLLLLQETQTNMYTTHVTNQLGNGCEQYTVMVIYFDFILITSFIMINLTLSSILKRVKVGIKLQLF